MEALGVLAGEGVTREEAEKRRFRFPLVFLLPILHCHCMRARPGPGGPDLSRVMYASAPVTWPFIFPTGRLQGACMHMSGTLASSAGGIKTMNKPPVVRVSRLTDCYLTHQVRVKVLVAIQSRVASYS